MTIVDLQIERLHQTLKAKTFLATTEIDERLLLAILNRLEAITKEASNGTQHR